MWSCKGISHCGTWCYGLLVFKYCVVIQGWFTVLHHPWVLYLVLCCYGYIERVVVVNVCLGMVLIMSSHKRVGMYTLLYANVLS